MTTTPPSLHDHLVAQVTKAQSRPYLGSGLHGTGNFAAQVSIASSIVDYVLPAIEGAWEEHGPMTTDHTRALTILTEELGESAKEVLEIVRSEREGDLDEAREARVRAILELGQVAAVAILMMSNIKEEL